MKAKILDILSDLESQKNVKVLYAAESGSRAWGFPSPDSDFDCRFIFVKPMDGYLSIVESDGQIGYPVDDVLDISGWDLQKTLRLVCKCNASPFEWLQSPIVYREEAGFRDQLWTLCQEFFNPKALIFHYLGIAKGALSKTNQEGNLTVKKFFTSSDQYLQPCGLKNSNYTTYEYRTLISIAAKGIGCFAQRFDHHEVKCG